MRAAIESHALKMNIFVILKTLKLELKVIRSLQPTFSFSSGNLFTLVGRTEILTGQEMVTHFTFHLKTSFVRFRLRFLTFLSYEGCKFGKSHYLYEFDRKHTIFFKKNI